MQRILTIFVLLLTTRVALGQQAVSFEDLIRPVFNKHCRECHGSRTQKGGLRLDARHGFLKGGDSGPIFVAGKSLDSELFRRVTSNDSEDRMPPEGMGLSADEIQLLKSWLDSGADWPESDYDREAAKDPRLQHWAFQKLQPVAVPEIDVEAKVNSGPLNEVDRFIVAKLQQRALNLNDREDRRSLIRRATLDLTGLPATPERIDQYVSDKSSDAWNDLIEELLASPRYGERWAQHWLDVVRFADTHGFEVNTPRNNAWPYRDYVIRAHNEDKPYDQFVREQLVGDMLQADEATGFLVAAAVLLPGQIGADDESKRLARQDALDEIIVGTSGTMLGLTIGCARCHDHKFDPITAKDYYALQAFFAGVEYGDRPIRDGEFEKKQARVKALVSQIADAELKLQSFEPIAASNRTLILDEEDKAVVTYLKKENGPGANPAGTKPGYKDDAGAVDRCNNISQGRYTWWNNVPGEDVMTWNPGVDGHFHLWLSWGAHGSGVHTRDARYILDRDGDLTTKTDQEELARIDQYFQAGITEGVTEQVPLWSGLQAVGEIELTKSSRILLRGGDTGTGITADVIVLRETGDPNDHTVSGGATEGRVETVVAASLPSLRSPISAKINYERVDSVPAKFVRFTTFATINDNQHEPCLDELEVYSSKNPNENIALASNGSKVTSSGNYSETGIHQLKHINDGLYGNDHSWISSQRGGGWVQIELPEIVSVDRIVWGRDRNGKFEDRFSVRYEITISTDGSTWEVIAGSSDRTPFGSPYDSVQSLLRNSDSNDSTELPELLTSLEKFRSEKSKLEAPTMVFGGTFREPDVTYLLRRGDPEQRVEETAPAIPALFSSSTGGTESLKSSVAMRTEVKHVIAEETQRRLDLANWIASADNPLTARVMVNRIWLNHFGRGIVDTPSDFGVNGTPPSHPELLDWLAAEFIRSGWSVKHIHRLIMQSATYRQSSQISQTAAEVDRDNILLWRFASRRLESEAIRDCLLFVSGELNLKTGGSGFNLFKARGGLDGFPPLEDFSTEEMRRMIYSHKVRMEQVPVFGAFDCPDAGQSMPRRGRSTTAIQALNLFNSPFVIDRSEVFATRIVAEFPGDTDTQMNNAFRNVFGRSASESEREACLAVVREHGLATLCRVLLNSNEFLFIP